MRYAEGSARRATQQVAIFFKQPKPQPDPPAAVAEAGVTPGETVVIGDTSFDMEMAINARARAIGVN